MIYIFPNKKINQLILADARRMFKVLSLTFLLTTGCTSASNEASIPQNRKNVILFVADGLRAASVKPQLTPNLARLKREGTWFANSHAAFPTMTMSNAAVLATGQFAGDNGFFSNSIFTGFPVSAQQGSVVPSLEMNAVIDELEARYPPTEANETLLSALRKAGFSTAAIGKHGPTRIFDFKNALGEATTFIDDSFSQIEMKALANDIQLELVKQKLATASPSRGANGFPGTKQANVVQQKYFTEVLTKVILPTFKKRNKPFAIVFWSRDPDGTYHFQGDSPGKLTPGINGPTSQAALKNVDNNIGEVFSALKRLELERNTDVVVTSDHGFSTISKQSKTSFAAKHAYSSVPIGHLPSGFLAIDLAGALGLKVFDATTMKPVDPVKGETVSHAALGRAGDAPEIVVVQNGGSNLVYLSDKFSDKKRVGDILSALVKHDYVSGLFLHDKFGDWPGTLPLSKIQFLGRSKFKVPHLLVGFKSFSTGCAIAVECTALVSDTPLQQGQGMHGSLSRADSFNFMAAIGPSFYKRSVVRTPVGVVDVMPTLLFNFNVKSEPTAGRILYEALSYASEPMKDSKASYTAELASTKALEGFKTILKYQTYQNKTYFDAAGFAGRTVGLE